MRPGDAAPITIDDAVLQRCALPLVASDTSKDGRGSVLVIGGTRETPGGVLLAGRAALRVGAGRLCLATVESISSALAIEVPEARVIPLCETADGSIGDDAAEHLVALVGEYDAVLLGPGMVEPEPITALVDGLLRRAPSTATIVLDAAALAVVSARADAVTASDAEVILIPNTKEMATLLECDEATARDQPVATLLDAVQRYDTLVALRGPDTWVTSPGDELYVERDGTPALATAGSGDVFAGALSGLIARGAAPLHALLWAVHLHASTGAALSARFGVGVLASDMVDALARTLASIEGRAGGESRSER